MIYDSTFEQIAYDFPWGLLAPIAAAALRLGGRPAPAARRDRAGVSGAAGSPGAFQRKSGSRYAGFRRWPSRSAPGSTAAGGRARGSPARCRRARG
jgi:hypothetical protein